MFSKSLGQHNAFIIADERKRLTEKTSLNHLNLSLYVIFIQIKELKMFWTAFYAF
jgi:hypothetical protein